MLDATDVEAIAQRTAELIAARSAEPQARYLDAAQLADALGVRRDWVYAHARELGGIRLGGVRGRLRFDLRQALRSRECRCAPREAVRSVSRASRRRARPPAGVDLLPYES
jgi:hypothetical protein